MLAGLLGGAMRKSWCTQSLWKLCDVDGLMLKSGVRRIYGELCDIDAFRRLPAGGKTRILASTQPY